ncbi:MAG: hypothetical protein P1V36_02710 [Planctomycetota bacterium]|nr:hypothetical protein [Planctomycetota bacterium]
MGRLRSILAFCAALTGLLGCGDAQPDADDLLAAEAPVVAPKAPVPGLQGLGSPGPAQDPNTAGPQATVDADARIHVPEDTRWGGLVPALRLSAQKRRDREHLEGKDPMLVSLPGLKGYVIVGGHRGRGQPGLDLVLKTGSERTVVESVGTAWIAAGGCEVQMLWEAEGWSLDLWRERVAALEALKGAGEHGIHVSAHSDVPVDELVAFLQVVADTHLGAPHLILPGRRRFEDPTDGALGWLSMHRLPETKGWDNELAPAFCDGLRMDTEPLAYDPRQAEDAGLSGLTLLAFLGAGYTNRGKHAYARTVSRGLRYLKTRQLPEGRFQGDPAWDDGVSHGFAALAMVEAYGMTGSPIFKGSAQRGLDALDATWRASRDDRLSTVLTAMCWRSAEIINEDCKRRGKPLALTLDAKLREALLKQAAHLESVTGDLELACALVTRLMLEPEAWKHDDVKSGAMQLAKAVAASGADTPPVLAYLTTIACFRVGYRAWKTYRKTLERDVNDTQLRDGHVCCMRGSWDVRGRPFVPGGRVAATALHALCLEVFYRYDKVLGVR